MALRTDDIDIRDVRMFMDIGGNGDYYLNLVEMKKDCFDHKGELIECNVLTSMRLSTSGGYAPHDVKMAIGELFRALEKHGLNNNPLMDDEGKYDRFGRN